MARHYRGIDARVTDPKVRLALQEIDVFLRETTRSQSAGQGGTPADINANGQFLLLQHQMGLPNARRHIVQDPIFASDGGAGNDYVLSLLFGTPALTMGLVNAEGTGRPLRVGASIALYDTNPPVALGLVALTGSSAFASRRDHVHLFPSTLRSTATTPGETLILTSDAVDAVLSFGQPGKNLTIASQPGVPLVTMFDPAGVNRGLWVNGHTLLGQGTPTFGTSPVQTAIVAIAERWQDVIAAGGQPTSALDIQPRIDDDLAGFGIDIVRYGLVFEGNFDPDVSGAAQPSIVGNRILMTGTVVGAPLGGSVNLIAASQANINITIPATSPTWTTMVGMDVQTLSIANVPPTRSMGLRVQSAGNGGTRWSGMFAGSDVQVNSTNKLLLGGGLLTKSTDGIYASSAGTMVFHIAGTDRVVLTNSVLFSNIGGQIGLGRLGNGWTDLWLRDTSALLENRVVFTSSPALSDNRTLTIDMENANRTLTFVGSPTLGDWFDQAVKTTSSPTFDAVKTDHLTAPSGGSQIDFSINDGVVVLQLAGGSWAPVSNGGAALGDSTLSKGWSYLLLKDTAASNELLIQASNLGADRTLTLDLSGNFTITLDGNTTLNDWFNQSVKTTAAPTFEDLFVNDDLQVSGTLTVLNLNVSGSGSLVVESDATFTGPDDITLVGGVDIILDTAGGGTKLGTGTTQLLGFWGKTPVQRPAAYTPTNVTTDRSYDANATTLDEVADVLGTLIADLQSVGMIG